MILRLNYYINLMNTFKFKCDKCLNLFCTQKTLDTHKNKFHMLKIDIQNTNPSTELSIDQNASLYFNNNPQNELSLNNNDILQFNNKPIKYFIHNDVIYFKAKNIAAILEYSDTKDAIKTHILEKDKFSVLYFKGGGILPPLDEKNKEILESEDQKTIFINESGLYSLILGSKKKEAKYFKHWVTSEVLPSIRKTGEYKINTITYDNTDNNDTEINDYIGKDCVYILHIKNDIYKFGYSSNLENRLNTHKNKLDYQKKIKFYILNNINEAKQLEKQIKYYLKQNNILISYENQKEIFKTDDIDSIIEKIDKFAESIQTKTNNTIEYNDEIDEDLTTEEMYKPIHQKEYILEIEKEKTKQIVSTNNVLLEKEKTKQMELEILFYKIKNNIT